MCFAQLIVRAMSNPFRWAVSCKSEHVRALSDSSLTSAGVKLGVNEWVAVWLHIS